VFIESRRVALHALMEAAFAIADIAKDVVFWIAAAARVLSAIVVNVDFAAAIPAIDVIRLMTACLAELRLFGLLSRH
jgi:hypothetical protein